MTQLLKTPKTNEEYLNDASYCPFCNSQNLNEDEGCEDRDTLKEMRIFVSCDDCHKEWYDILTLTGYREKENV